MNKCLIGTTKKCCWRAKWSGTNVRMDQSLFRVAQMNVQRTKWMAMRRFAWKNLKSRRQVIKRFLKDSYLSSAFAKVGECGAVDCLELLSQIGFRCRAGTRSTELLKRWLVGINCKANSSLKRFQQLGNKVLHRIDFFLIVLTLSEANFRKSQLMSLHFFTTNKFLN